MRQTIKYLLIGIIAMLAYATVFAPASLIKLVVESETTVSLTELEGSVWNGGAYASLVNPVPGTDIIDLGRLTWKFAPFALFTLNIFYEIKLIANSHNFSGSIEKSFGSIHIEGDMSIEEELLDQVLAPYDINVSERLEINAIDFRFSMTQEKDSSLPRIEQLAAKLFWNGGIVQYRLSGQTNRLELPALRGTLETVNNIPNMQIYLQGESNETNTTQGQIPLIKGRLEQNGWVSLGITKKFTILLNQPWPGSEPDHAVVLEVQEKLF